VSRHGLLGVFLIIRRRVNNKRNIYTIVLAQLYEWSKHKRNANAQAYTFAIRTSRHTDLKLQKSMFLANAPQTGKEI